ncbi:transposase [Pyramidobacter porci]|nr:transposase [Pyramidobacter porci]
MLAGDQKPDFRTVSRFRADMKEIIEEVFYAVIKLLIKNSYIKLENYFLDGTKIEANTNKYTFTWKKNVIRYDRKLDEKVRLHLKEIDRITAEENTIYQDADLEETGENAERITSEQVKSITEEIEKRLQDKVSEKDTNTDQNKAIHRKLKKALKEFKDDRVPRKERYEHDLEVFGERNSYSKTDHDATFMRMKEDHMLNGQLNPGYNVQIGTENTYIVGYTIPPNPTDTKTLILHLEHVEEQLGRLPHTVIADSGYGSEENYEYLKQHGCKSCVKYGTYHKEQTKKYQNTPFLADNMPYDPESDSYTCPNGKKLEHVGNCKYTTEASYQARRDIYRCANCGGCSYVE